jgi:Mn-containing catalase
MSTDRNKVVTLEQGNEFTYHEDPPTSAFMVTPTHSDSRFYGTTDISNTVEKRAGTVQDKLDRQ